jgi:hypothetical protein
LGEEVHRRLSGQGFSPQERRAKKESEVRFLAGEPNGLTNPSSSLNGVKNLSGSVDISNLLVTNIAEWAMPAAIVYFLTSPYF